MVFQKAGQKKLGDEFFQKNNSFLFLGGAKEQKKVDDADCIVHPIKPKLAIHQEVKGKRQENQRNFLPVVPLAIVFCLPILLQSFSWKHCALVYPIDRTAHLTAGPNG